MYSVECLGYIQSTYIRPNCTTIFNIVIYNSLECKYGMATSGFWFKSKLLWIRCQLVFKLR